MKNGYNPIERIQVRCRDGRYIFYQTLRKEPHNHTEYIIIEGYSTREIESNINIWCKKGYHLLGDMDIVIDSAGMCTMWAAMVK